MIALHAESNCTLHADQCHLIVSLQVPGEKKKEVLIKCLLIADVVLSFRRNKNLSVCQPELNHALCGMLKVLGKNFSGAGCFISNIDLLI